jgi:hypothetical protein
MAKSGGYDGEGCVVYIAEIRNGYKFPAGQLEGKEESREMYT